MLAKTLLDIVVVKDKDILSVCHEVSQYRLDPHFEKGRRIESMLDAYDGWVMYRMNVFFTILALFLFHFIPISYRIVGIAVFLLWLLVFGVHAWFTLRRFQIALPYICVDELYCRKVIRSEIIEK